MRAIFLATCLTLIAGVANTPAHHKPGHPMPPGQAKKLLPPELVIVAPPPEVEEVCLVTTDTPGDPFAPVIVTEWLPRDVAESRAEAGDSFVIYHPDFNSEVGCVSF
jgi:hypothetical protein